LACIRVEQLTFASFSVAVWNTSLFFTRRNFVFLHSLRGYKNVVVSPVMEVFVRSEEYRKAYAFANVKPCDNQDRITYCLRVKFADNIVSDMNVVQ